MKLSVYHNCVLILLLLFRVFICNSLFLHRVREPFSCLELITWQSSLTSPSHLPHPKYEGQSSLILWCTPPPLWLQWPIGSQHVMWPHPLDPYLAVLGLEPLPLRVPWTYAGALDWPQPRETFRWGLCVCASKLRLVRPGQASWVGAVASEHFTGSHTP